MFERPHHRRIAHVLYAIDGERLAAHGALFGGGTCIALRFGEYRESVDIDFLVADADGYRALRQCLTSPEGWDAMRRPGAPPLEHASDVRADQYGIRTRLRMDGEAIKIEVVREARIALEPPGVDDVVCGVRCLRLLDLATSKLLANADRRADDSVFSRDVIDLAMMQARLPLLRQAIAKAEAAYGDAIRRDLARSIDVLQNRDGWLERCMRAMGMTVPRAVVWQRVRALRRALTG